MNNNSNKQPGPVSRAFTIIIGIAFMVFWGIFWGLQLIGEITSGQTTQLMISIFGLIFGELVLLHNVLQAAGTQIFGVLAIIYGSIASRKVDRNIRRQAGGYDKHRIGLNKNKNSQNSQNGQNDNPYGNYGDGSKYM